jgi:fatty-acyl-CoA synthase
MTTHDILPLPESTYRLLLDAAGTWPDGIATQWIPDPADHTRCLDWTYAELAGTVTRIANALTALGVRRGDAVTLASVNTSMLYAATLAAQAVGIAAPVNPALSGERIAELIRRTGSRVLVTAGPELDPQLWARLAGVARQAGMTAVLALRPDGAHGDPPALDLTGDAPAGGTPDTPDGRGPFVAYLDEVIAGQPSGYLAGADLPQAADLAAFVHTGGTTGAPKVAAHTHANQLACGRGIALCSGLAPGEAMLGGLPLFHVNALIVTGIAPMFSGARVVWPGPAGYRDKALYARFWTIVEQYRIAAMSAVPTVYATLAQVPVDADISTLRLPIVGAAPLPASVREDFARHTGRRLLEGYGLTEATCVSTWTRPGEERPGSVGRVLPGQQVKAVRIADGSWADCAPGETGVLVIGGPAVFAGYVTDPRLGGPRVSQDGAVRNGWLDTGDLGSVDADGFVYLAGRAKDLIIRGGHNIDPKVIEDALLAHPAVAAAAVGRPDRHSGEVPVAYVVPADAGRFDEADLLAWAADAIDEPAARPKRVYPVDAIPVTEVGKHFKPALAADAAARAITEALAAAGLPDARATAAHQDGRLVVTVTGAGPGRVRDAVAGFALTVRCGPSPGPRPPRTDPQKAT